METPPCVRGRLFYKSHICEIRGNTPVCAGKTTGLALQQYQLEKHPRVCGEDLHVFFLKILNMETPPCVRGRLQNYNKQGNWERNTPVCAGKTATYSSVVLLYTQYVAYLFLL